VRRLSTPIKIIIGMVVCGVILFVVIVGITLIGGIMTKVAGV